MTTPLLPGKLPASLLAALLRELPAAHPQLLLGPSVGEDAAVIDFAPGHPLVLVAKSDPITFATDEIGYYAVNVCANDLAVTGATPRFFLPTLLLPAGETRVEMARAIFTQIGIACTTLNIVVAGGHSEVTHTVNQPVVAGTMLGEAPRDRFISTRGCRPGDLVLMAGYAPVEGTSIIAREKRVELEARGWTPAALDEAADYLFTPGISVLAPAQLAAASGLVTSMHDPTEGGVATGLQELALAAGVGLEIELDAIPVPPSARRLCAEFGLDPLGVIASGALLATCAPEHAPQLVQRWQEHGWPGQVIGRATGEHHSLLATRHGRPVRFPTFIVDEITKLWL
jgi:hydrogenase maturation factor